MSNASRKGAKGLRLTLEGAPLTPHMVAGVPGYYNPHRATPVGGDGELDLEYAKKLADDPAVPLELVDIKADDVDGVRKLAKSDLTEARSGAVKSRRSRPSGFETTLISDHLDAQKEA